jgi:prepilin-type N-terminal cleavage/methylation domain-containing protein
MQRQRMIGLMSGKSNTGFTFIEILIALLIIGILMRVGVPRFIMRGTPPIDDVVEQINKLTRLAYVRAILSGKLYRVMFKFAGQGEIQLEVVEKEQAGEPVFQRAKDMIIKSSFMWDSRFEVVHFFIKGIDEAQGGLLKDAWFYVLPSGVSQDIIIDIRDRQTGDVRGLVLNPFSVKFTLYDTVQTPS